MAKVTSIDPIQRVVARDPELAIAEMGACTLDALDQLEKLGKKYPGAVAIAAVAFGKPTVVTCSISSDADGAETMHMSPVAEGCARLLAWYIARWPQEVLASFEAELNRDCGGSPIRSIESTAAKE